MRKLLCLTTLMTIAACGDSADDHHNESPQDEICEHLISGPSQSLTAASARADAPEARVEHTRLDVTLPQSGSTNSGWVLFSSAEATEYLIGLDNDVPLAVVQGTTGSTIAAEASAAGPCAEAKIIHTFDLEVGAYHLKFGPTAETTVRMVSEEAAHHEE